MLIERQYIEIKTFYFRYYPATAQINFVFLTTLYRWFWCRHPIRTQYLVTHRRIKIVAGLTWLILLLVPTLFYFGNYSITFQYDICRIDSMSVSSVMLKFAPIVGNVICFLLPYVMIIIFTITLALFAEKVTAKRVYQSHRKIVVVTITVAGVLLVAWAPFIVVFFLNPLIHDHKTELKRLTQYFAMLSFCANPVIYTLINRNFKNFLKRSLTKFSFSSVSSAKASPGIAAVHMKRKRQFGDKETTHVTDHDSQI